MTHLHDADLVFDCLSLLRRLGLSELESKELAISDALASEDSREAADALFTNDFVILRGILLLDISCVLNFPLYLTTVLQSVFRSVELTEDDLEQSARVVGNFFLAENVHLDLKRLWQADPLNFAIGADID